MKEKRKIEKKNEKWKNMEKWKKKGKNEKNEKNEKKWKKWEKMKKWKKTKKWKKIKKMKKWKKVKKWKNKKNEKKWKNGKNGKNEKNEKTKKMEKNDEKRKKNEKNWIQTQNPRRFPGFTIVVVTFFVKILDDFHDFVSEGVSFPRKINNPFWVVIVFSEEKWQFSLDVKQKHTFYRRKWTKKSLRSAHLTIIILLE